MAARKSRFSKEAKVNRERYGRARRVQHRPTLPVVVIVCDDARTAVAYFNLLKRLVKSSVTLKVLRHPSDRAQPDDVIEAAKSELEALGEPDDDDRSSVWALIDMEQDHARRMQAEAAKDTGSNAGIKVALSDPCYEVWTLLHLIDTGEKFMECRAVLTRIEQEWQREFGTRFGPKAQADYSKIISQREVAAGRARAHHNNGDPSWTEVYLLIDEIANFCS